MYFYSEVDRDSTYELIRCLRDSEKYCLKLCYETKIESILISFAFLIAFKMEDDDFLVAAVKL